MQGAEMQRFIRQAHMHLSIAIEETESIFAPQIMQIPFLYETHIESRTAVVCAPKNS